MSVPSLPEKVTILGRTFTVELMPRTEIKVIMESESTPGSDGGMYYIDRRILVADDLGPEDTLVTFLHECNHAIDYITGFNQIISRCEQELLAETRAVGFHDVIRCLYGW